jgi:hypothetical protein
MLEEMMAAYNANYFKSGIAQCDYDFLSRQPWKPRHDTTLMV